MQTKAPQDPMSRSGSGFLVSVHALSVHAGPLASCNSPMVNGGQALAIHWNRFETIPPCIGLLQASIVSDPMLQRAPEVIRRVPYG